MKSFLALYEEAVARASTGRDDPNVKRLVDGNIDVMTKAYVTGHLDEPTRKQLLKTLVDMRDARAGQAFVKVLDGCMEPNTADELTAVTGAIDVLVASAKLEQPVIDALWGCFTRYSPSKTNSILSTLAIHDSILAVKDPSYGPKAVIAIGAPVVLDDTPSLQGTAKVNDHLEFWQTTSIQVIKTLHYTPAARSLVTVLMTRNKLGLALLAQAALTTMPNEAEPLLAAALDGSDPELAKLTTDWGTDKGYIPVVLNVLSYTSLDAARDAAIAFVPRLDNDPNRAALAMTLIWYARTPQVLAAFKGLYAKLPAINDEAGAERSQLLGVVSEFFDPTLGAWALAEADGAKGQNMLSAKASALQSAIKLMRPSDKPSVEKALARLQVGLTPNEKRDVGDNLRGVYKLAAVAVDKCATDPTCYAKLLDDPVPQVMNANWTAIKAAYMAGVLGNEQTRKELIAHLPNVTNPGARLAVAAAINHLAPKGDAQGADALEKIVAEDLARKEPNHGDDGLAKVARMLRARAH